MNLLFRLLAVGSLLTASVSFAANAFEGKVTLAMTSGKSKPQDLNYAIKQDAMRIEITADGQMFATIMDLKKMEMLILMSEQKTYMVMPIKDTVDKAMAKAEGKEPDIEKTGRTETILGYKCDKYIAREKKNVTEIWVAEGLGSFMGLGNNGGGGGGLFGGGKSKAASSWEEKFKGKSGFPLRVVTRDAKNKETFRMEATKIEPGSLPASLFQPPAGWKKFDLPSMGGLLKGLGQ
ncbi:MAG TPA: DUF4412 domain-containing protein [Lacunisphaera sp.]|nr:DUF4412 domain-containing protein [Lacunisphaera sp.]